MAPQTVARVTRIEHSRGSGTISQNLSLAVARQGCGAIGGGVKRLRTFVSAPVFEALLRGNTPIGTNGSLSRASICGATNTIVEKGS